MEFRAEADDPVRVDSSGEQETADRLARDSWPLPRVEFFGGRIYLDGRDTRMRGERLANEIAESLGVRLERR